MANEFNTASIEALAFAAREATAQGIQIHEDFTLTGPEVDAMLRGFRSVTGSPVYVPPSIYRAAKEAGLDMSNIEETKPIPHR